MIEPWRITVVQARVRPVFRGNGDVQRDALEENLEHACDLVRRGARVFGSRLFVFPEFFLQGFDLGRSNADWIAASLRIPGPETERLGQAAREANAYIAGMSYELIDDFPGRYFNTGFIVSPRGEVVLRYRKLYSLTGKTTPADVYDEYTRLYGGPESLFPVIDTPLGRIGVMNCYDINFPEGARCLALRGAEILLHVTSEGTGPHQAADGGWTIARRARAYENTCYLAMANTGPIIDTELPPGIHHGHSQIIGFDGRVIHMAEGADESLVTATIDIEALRRRRTEHRMNFLAELVPGVHAPIYTRATGWPLNRFANEPMSGPQDNVAVYGEVLERMRRNGIFAPPSAERHARLLASRCLDVGVEHDISSRDEE
ncbi:MAG: nitrilase-related carbon-nitrogen hydrolase [Burkholderiales bacterium]